MSADYTIEKQNSPFSDARSKFRSLIAWLESPETDKEEHYELERGLQEGGLELLRLLFAGHLEMRALREHRLSSLTGDDGVARTHVRDSERGLMTVFGPVRVPRLQYSKPGVQSRFPADAELNLPSELYSHGLGRHVAEQSALGSFEQVVEFVSQHTGGHVPKRQVEQLAARAAVDFDEYYEHGRATEPEQTDDLLVLSFDGKGIVVLPRDLREYTKQALKRSQHKLQKRLSIGEKRNRKRIAQVATVYTVERQQRTPQEVMGELGPVRDVDEPRPKARNKRVWASVEKQPEQVIEEAFQEALRRDPQQQRQWIVLVDGDPHQEKRIRRCAASHDVEVVVLIDVIHVLEYLWKAAWCFFSPGDKKAEQWVVKRAIAILEGRASAVAGGIRRSATMRHLTGSKRKNVDTVCKYLLNHSAMMRYDLALEQGYPIATGIVEGACRHLVKDRMELTGARWSLDGAEAVLRLRALRVSGDFNDYWTFHLHQEHQRNHVSQFEKVA